MSSVLTLNCLLYDKQVIGCITALDITAGSCTLYAKNNKHVVIMRNFTENGLYLRVHLRKARICGQCMNQIYVMGATTTQLSLRSHRVFHCQRQSQLPPTSTGRRRACPALRACIMCPAVTSLNLT